MSRRYTLRIGDGISTPAITTLSLASATVGVAYSVQLNYSDGGGSLATWSVDSGSLPSGIALSTTGLLSGTASVPGTSNFTVRVTNTDGGTDTRALSIEIASNTALAAYTTWRDNAVLFGDWRYITGDPASGTQLWQRNYYDRAYHWYFVNDATFNARANEQAAEEWNVYYHPNGYTIPPRGMHPDGYAEYYFRNGDVGMDGPVLNGLEAMAWYMTQYFIEKGWVDTGNWEGRIQERALLCTMTAHAINVPGQRKDYRAAAKRCFDGIVGTQNLIGSTYNGAVIDSTSHPMYGSWTPPSSAYTRLDGLGQASTNFMAVQAMGAVVRYIEYYDSINDLEAGARAQAIATLEAGCDYLWDHNWSATEKAFFYFSHQTTNGGPSAAQSLNMLYPEVWGWLWHQTGATKWRDQGDEIFTQGASTQNGGFEFVTGSVKQYNQAIRGPWRYIYWRDGISLSHILNPTEVHTP